MSSSPEPIEMLRSGLAAWNDWRGQDLDLKIDLSEVDLSPKAIEGTSLATRKGGADLRGFNLQGVDLSFANLEGAYLDRANLQHALLIETRLAGARLRRTNARHAQFTEARLEGALLVGCRLERAILDHARMRRCRCSRAKLNEADLSDADLTKADLSGASLKLANLSRTNLTFANLARAELDDANLMDTCVNRTEISTVIYTGGHQALYDNSSSVKVWWRDRYLNWSVLRLIGALPLFGVSYVGLFLSVAVISGVGFANDTMATFQRNLSPDSSLLLDDLLPLPMPRRIGLALIASVLLAVGSTLYKVCCPKRVQEFSETRWVEERGRARLLYLAECWRRRWQQIATLAATVTGGALTLYLIGDRLHVAILYLWHYGFFR